VGKLFCKKGLWGKLGRLGTRLREYSNLETNNIVREDKGEVGKCLDNTEGRLARVWMVGPRVMVGFCAL
jgi:hypothetical protein